MTFYSMTKVCRQCQTSFEITNDDLAFYEKVSPVFNGKKELIPPPTLCPECRQQRRLAFRNERSLYQRTCDKTGRAVISMFRPEAKRVVYDRSEWYGDGWDPLQFGRTYDFTLPFSAQFKALLENVPMFGIYHMTGNNRNSEYCNHALDNKDCYLGFSITFSEDCYYCTMTDKCRNCMDCLNIVDSELCFECVDCSECYGSQFLQRCRTCTECFLCTDCVSCRDCFGCVNLSNKQYHWFNEAIGKEEYDRRMVQVSAGEYKDLSHLRQRFHAHSMNFPRKSSHQTRTENCQGENLLNCKNAIECYEVHDAEDVKYLARSFNTKDSHDGYGVAGNELTYEIQSGRGYGLCFSQYSYDDNDCYYLSACFNCSNCFGCVGLRNKSYCILNKQYTKEEYEELVPRIIKQMTNAQCSMNNENTNHQSSIFNHQFSWGEFFPPSLSPFGYNETVAMEYYPLAKEEALKLGFNWSDYVSPPPQVEKIVKASQLPDSIFEIRDSILDWAIECEVSGKPFRIIKQELRFLREYGLPLPRRHPDVRHLDRMRLRNPRKLFSRTCAKCTSPIQTTYSPDRPEKVYCEECYLKEVY